MRGSPGLGKVKGVVAELWGSPGPGEAGRTGRGLLTLSLLPSTASSPSLPWHIRSRGLNSAQGSRLESLSAWGGGGNLPCQRWVLWAGWARVGGAPHSTFPGFMRFLGSSVALICLMTVSPSSPISSRSRWRLPRPMPCSPVQVPSRARARLGGEGAGYASAGGQGSWGEGGWGGCTRWGQHSQGEGVTGGPLDQLAGGPQGYRNPRVRSLHVNSP